MTKKELDEYTKKKQKEREEYLKKNFSLEDEEEKKVAEEAKQRYYSDPVRREAVLKETDDLAASINQGFSNNGWMDTKSRTTMRSNIYKYENNLRRLRNYGYNTDEHLNNATSMHNLLTERENVFNSYKNEEAYNYAVRQTEKRQKFTKMTDSQLDTEIKRLSDAKDAYKKRTGGKILNTIGKIFVTDPKYSSAYDSNLKGLDDYDQEIQYAKLEKANRIFAEIDKLPQNVQAMLNEYVALSRQSTQESISDTLTEFAGYGDTTDDYHKAQRNARDDRQFELTEQLNASLAKLGYDPQKIIDYAQYQYDETEAGHDREYYAKLAEEHPVISSAISVLASPAKALGVAGAIGDALNKNDLPANANSPYYLANDIVNTTRDTVMENTNWNGKYTNIDWFDQLYSTVMSTGDSLLAAYLGGGTGGIVTGGAGAALSGMGSKIAGGLIGMSAMSDTAQKVAQNGGSKGQALLTGLFAGINEALWESLSIGQFGALAEKEIEKVFSKDGVKTVIGNLLKSSGVNASEELNTEIANIFFDYLINGSTSDYGQAYENALAQGMSEEEARNAAAWSMSKQALEAGLGGALQGVLMGGGATAIAATKDSASIIDNAMNDTRRGNQLKADGTFSAIQEQIGNLDNEKLQKQADKAAQKMADGKKVSARKLGSIQRKAYMESSAQAAAATEEAVTAQLKEYGDANAEKTAKTLVNMFKGKEVDFAALAENEAAQRVISEYFSEEGANWVSDLNSKLVNARNAAYKIASGTSENIIGDEYKFPASERQSVINSAEYGAPINTQMRFDNEISQIKKAQSELAVKADAEMFDTEDIEIDDDNGAEEFAVMVNDKGEISSLIIDGDNIPIGEAKLTQSGAELASGLNYISKELGLDFGTANTVLGEFYNTDLSAKDYIKAARLVVRAGQIGNASMLNSELAKALPENVRNALYSAAREARINKSAKAQSVVDKAKGKKKGKTAAVTYIDEKGNRVSVENFNDGKALKEIFKGVSDDKIAQIMFLSDVAAALGTDITFTNTRGGTKLYNAFYNGKTNSFNINIDAGRVGEEYMAFSASHELTHFIKQWSPAKYNEFADYLVQAYSENDAEVEKLNKAHPEWNGADVESLIRHKIELSERIHDAEVEKLNKAHPEWSDAEIEAACETYVFNREQAFDEVVADSCESFLLDSNIAERLKELQQQDMSLFDKVRDWLSKFIDNLKKVREIIKNGNYSARSAEAQLVKAFGEQTDTLIKLWEDALVDAREASVSTDGTMSGSNIFQYAGESAETADKSLLEQAKEMLKNGDTSEQIRKTTGWFKGYDGKWRFEIDDSKSKFDRKGFGKFDADKLALIDIIAKGETGFRKYLDKGVNSVIRVGDIYKNEVLFEAYPELRDYKVSFEILPNNMGGVFNEELNRITLNYNWSDAELKDTILHELQHAVQTIEGFASGSNPESWQGKIENGYDARPESVKREETRLFEQYNKLRSDNPEFVDAMEKLEKSKPTVPRGKIDFETFTKIEPDPVEWQTFDKKRNELEKAYGSSEVSKYMTLYNRLTEVIKKKGRSASELYYNTAGEIEARDVEKRAALTAEQRKNTRPDIDRTDVVFAEGDKSYAIGYTISNKPVAIIEDDILNGVPKSEWIKTVKKKITERFSNGIPISGRLIKVNRITKSEFTNSKYSKYIKVADGTIYADKFKTANNLDDVILATTNYINEDLNHKRTDNIKEFARGDVLIRVGNNDYSANVIVGFTNGNNMVLYDIVDFSKTSFKLKKKTPHISTMQNAGSQRNETSSNGSISGFTEKVNNNSENNFQLTEDDTEYLTLAKNPEKNGARLREMVDAAAKAAGYVSLVYHGSESENRFNKFNVPAFFSSDRKVAKSYATEGTDNVYSVYLNTENFYELDGKGDPNRYIDIPDDLRKFVDAEFRNSKKGVQTDVLADAAKNAGYNGIVFYNIGDNGSHNREWIVTDAERGFMRMIGLDNSDVYVAFAPEQVKSADLVTYDDSGNIIPLSERFNNANDDIRYQYSDYDDFGLLDDEYDAEFDTEGTDAYEKFNEDYTRLESLRELIKAKKPKKSTIIAAANIIEKKYGITTNAAKQEFIKRLEAYYDDINSGATGANAFKTAQDMAAWLFEQRKDLPRDEYAQTILNDLRTRRVSLSAEQKAEVAGTGWDSFGDYRKSLMGSIIISNDGQSMEDLFSDLSNSYPDYFDAAENPIDMPSRLSEIISNLRSSFVAEDTDSAIKMLATDIYDSYWNVTTLNEVGGTVAAKDIRALQKEHDKAVEKIQKDYEKRAEKVKERYERAKGRRELTESKQKMRKRITKAVKRVDKLLRHGDKYNHIPENMRNATVDFLSVFAERYELSPEAKSAIELLKDKKYRLTDEQAKVVKERYGGYVAFRDMLKGTIKISENAEITLADGWAELSRILPGLDSSNIESEMPSSLLDEIDYINNDKVIVSPDSKYSDSYYAKSSGVFARGQLDRLLEAYDSLADANVTGYSEDVASLLKELKSTLDGKSLSQLNEIELMNIETVVNNFYKIIKDGNEMFINGKREERSGIVNNMLAQFKAHKPNAALGIIARLPGGNDSKFSLAKAVGSITQNVTPIYYFKNIGGEMQRMWNDFRDGQDNYARYKTQIQNYIADTRKKHNYEKWADQKEKFTFTDNNGENVELDIQQALTLYATAKRETTLGITNHLASGITFEDRVRVEEVDAEKVENESGGKSENKKPKDKKEKIKVLKFDRNPHQITLDTLTALGTFLTDEQKAYADDMVKFLSTDMADIGNATSMELYNIKLFREQYYFPFNSDKNFLATTYGEVEQNIIKQASFTHALTKDASTALILSDFDEIWASHCNQMALYASVTVPMSNIQSVMNYKTSGNIETGANAVALKAEFEASYGKPAKDYFDTLMTDINGGIRADSREGFFGKLVSAFKKNAVFASASVVLQQPSAIGRAFAYIEPKYFAKTLVTKRDYEECKKYNGVAVIKESGSFDTGVGRSAVDDILKRDYDTTADKVKGFFYDKSVGGVKGVLKNSYRDEVLSWAPGKADEITWCHIWNACKAKVRAEQKLTGEAMYQAAAKEFRDVIDYTQVYDSTFARSGLMRSKSLFMKSVTAFMAEPTVSLNMLMDAAQGLNKGKTGVKFFGRALGAFVSSVLINSILKSLATAPRDDDEDETIAEKYLGNLVGNFLDELNPLNMIPYIRDIWSLLQGYDVERADVSVFADCADAIKNIYNDNMSLGQKIEGIAGAAGALTGVPAKNIMRDIRGIVNIFKFAKINNTIATSEGITRSIYEAFGKDVEMNALYAQIVEANGDVNSLAYRTAYQTLIRSGKTDTEAKKAISSGIRKALRENDARIINAAAARINGNVSEYTAIAKQMKSEGNYSQDDIVSAISSEVNWFNSKVADAKELENNGESTKAITKELRKKGYSDELIQSKIVSYVPEEESEAKHKSLYTRDDIAAAIAESPDLLADIKKDLIQVNEANGKDNEAATSSAETTIRSAIHDAVDADDISESMASELLSRYGGYDVDTAANKAAYWIFKKSYPEISMEMDEDVYAKYSSKVAPSGISIADFYGYYKATSKMTGTDANGDGKTDSGSRQKKVCEYIDSMPITKEQKDALWFAEGWVASTLYKAPWH